MSIETLSAVPQMVRDEDKGRFVYEDIYRDQVFIFGNEYLYFHETSYDRIPRQILDFVVYNVVADHIQEITVTNHDEASSDTISAEVIKYFQENGTKLSEAVKDMLLPQFDAINEQIEKLGNEFSFDSNTDFEDNDKQKLAMCIKEITILKEQLSKATFNPPAVVEVPTPKVNIGLLLALKESGYSVDEIKKLKDDGLI